MPLHSNSTPPPATKCSRPQHMPVTARHLSLTLVLLLHSLSLACSLAAPSPSLPPEPNPNLHAFFACFFLAYHSSLPSFERTRIIITTSAATFNKWVPRHVAGRPQLLARASPVCHGYGGLVGDPEEHLVVNFESGLWREGVG